MLLIHSPSLGPFAAGCFIIQISKPFMHVPQPANKVLGITFPFNVF